MTNFLTRYPFDPRGKSVRRQRVLLAVTAVVTFCAAVCLGLLCLYFSTLYLVLPRFLSYFDFPMLILLNLLPVVLLVMGLWAVTGRAWLAFSLSSVLTLAMVFGNYFKAAFRGDPFVAEDLKVLGAAAGIAGEYEIRFPPIFWKAIALCLIGTLVLLVFFRGRIPGARARFLTLTLLIAIAIGSYGKWYQDPKLYNSFENKAYFNQWVPKEKFASRGFFYPFLYSLRDAKETPPDGYSPTTARALLDAYPDAEIPEEKKVNLICIQLESFSDLSACGIEFDVDPYADFHALCAEGLSGTMLSDSMGGGTSNAERSFLTGYLYPHPNYRRQTESYVWYLRGQGYYTAGGHPGHAWFYNRQNVMQCLGFEQYRFLEGYYNDLTGGEYGTDAMQLPDLYAQFQTAKAFEKPIFLFDITYQGHSPYDTTQLTWGDTVYLDDPVLSSEEFYTVNNYLAGCADTGAQLRALCDALREEDAPVVLLFYGDHKPTLGSGNSAYTKLGVSFDISSVEGLTNYYATPYCIWANDAAKAVTGASFSGEGPTVGPYFLMTLLFDQLGWEGPSYMQLGRATMAQTPVVHSTGAYLTSDGALTRDAEADDLRIAQFYLRKTRYEAE